MKRPTAKQSAALLAATAALVGALVGNFALRASASGSTAGREADRAAAEVVSGYVAGQSSLEHQRELEALAAQYEERRLTVTGLARVASQPQEAAGLQDQAGLWADQRDTVLGLSRVLTEAADEARSGEPEAPALSEATADALDRYAAELSETADLSELRQAAKSREAGAWGAKGDEYAAAVALLAVAVFLSALSLIVMDRLRAWLLVPAAILLVVGVVWAGSTARRSVRATPDEALVAVAEGDRLVAVGETEEALSHFDVALAADAALPEAYIGRADVHIAAALDAAGGPDVVVSMVRDEGALADALADAERAAGYGYADADLWFRLGTLRYLAGDLDGALAANQRGIDRSPNEAQGWLSAAVYRTEAGDRDQAEAALEEGLARVAEPPDDGIDRQLLAATRSELARVADEHPDAAELAAELRSRLALDSHRAAGGEAASTAAAGGTELVGPVTFAIEGGRIRAEHRLAAPVDTPLLYTWSARTGPDDPWVEQPWAEEVAVAEADAVDGRSGKAAAPLLDPGACPDPAVEYRLEVWAAGELVSTDLAADGEGEPLGFGEDLGPTTPGRPGGLGIEYCRPDDWTSARSSTEVDSLEGTTLVVETTGPPWVTLTLYAAYPGPVADGTDLEAANIDALRRDLFAEINDGSGPVRVLLPEGPTRRFDFAGDTGLLAEYVIEDDEDPRWYAIGTAFGQDGVLRSFRIRADQPMRTAGEALRDSIRFAPGPAVAAARPDAEEAP